MHKAKPTGTPTNPYMDRDAKTDRRMRFAVPATAPNGVLCVALTTLDAVEFRHCVSRNAINVPGAPGKFRLFARAVGP